MVLGTLTCEDAMAELGSATRITLLSPLLSRTPEQRWDHIWHRHHGTRQAGKGSRKTGEDGASPPHPCTGNLPDMGAKEGKRTAQGAGCTAGMLGRTAQLEHPKQQGPRQFLTASPHNHFHFCKSTFSRREPRLRHVVLCQGLPSQEPPFLGTGLGLQQSIPADFISCSVNSSASPGGTALSEEPQP